MKTRQTIYTAGAAGASAMGVVGVVTRSRPCCGSRPRASPGSSPSSWAEKRQTCRRRRCRNCHPMPVEPLPTGTPGSTRSPAGPAPLIRWDDLLPLVDQMHPDAGLQLRKALADVDPRPAPAGRTPRHVVPDHAADAWHPGRDGGAPREYRGRREAARGCRGLQRRSGCRGRGS